MLVLMNGFSLSVCVAEGFSDKVVSLRSYGNPREGSYTHISDLNHAELIGLTRLLWLREQAGSNASVQRYTRKE